MGGTMKWGAWLARGVVWAIFKLTSHIEVEGLENVPSQGSAVVVSNHVGRLDAPLVYYLLDRQDIIMLAAEKYRESAFFSWFARQLDAIWVDRFNADFSALREALNRLKKGGILVIAPEGTRSKDGKLGPGQPGASYMAAKAGAPVIPVAVTGTEDFLVRERLRHFKRLQLKLQVGEPFYLPPVNSGGREAQMEAYTDEIMCRIAALLPPESYGFYAGHPRLQELLAG